MDFKGTILSSLNSAVLSHLFFFPTCITSAFDQEPVGPRVYLKSMSQTPEPSNDGATVTEGLKYPYIIHLHLLLITFRPYRALGF